MKLFLFDMKKNYCNDKFKKTLCIKNFFKYVITTTLTFLRKMLSQHLQVRQFSGARA